GQGGRLLTGLVGGRGCSDWSGGGCVFGRLIWAGGCRRNGGESGVVRFKQTPFHILLLLPTPVLAPRIPWFAIAFYSGSAPMSEMHPWSSSPCGVSQCRFRPGEEAITNPTSRLTP